MPPSKRDVAALFGTNAILAPTQPHHHSAPYGSMTHMNGFRNSKRPRLSYVSVQGCTMDGYALWGSLGQEWMPQQLVEKLEREKQEKLLQAKAAAGEATS